MAETNQNGEPEDNWSPAIISRSELIYGDEGQLVSERRFVQEDGQEREIFPEEQEPWGFGCVWKPLDQKGTYLAPSSADERGKSTLLNKTGTLVGYGFGKNPERAGWSMNVWVYKTDDQWVLCLSDLPDRLGDIEVQNVNLGSKVPGILFAPSAVRGIGTEIPYADVRKTLDESLASSAPQIQMQWLAGEP